MKLKNKTVIVTGGAGFIGSHLVDRLILEEPKKIIVADNFYLGNSANLEDAKNKFVELDIIKIDIAEYEKIDELLTKYTVDVIFHLAAIPLPLSLKNPDWVVDKQIAMTNNLVRLIKKGKYATLIQFSSSEVYGSAIQNPMSEEHPFNPRTPYAGSKAAADTIALSYHHTFGCDIRILRPFNQYGPRQNIKWYPAIIPKSVSEVMNGKELVIHGDGNQTRDFSYVGDTVDAAIKMYENPQAKGRAINVGSGKETKIKDLIESLAKIMDYKKEILHEPKRAGDVNRHIAKIGLAKEILGWTPKMPFEEGLKNTIAWYKQNLKK